MRFSGLSELFSLRDIRNGAIGLLIVIVGIGLAMLTYYAHSSGLTRLAGISAGLSLIFVLLILIFVVPPLARNASKEVSQLNLPFEFTAGGAIMLGLVMIVGFSAWNSGNNLLFLVLSFLAASMFVGFFAGSLSLKKLDVKMRFPESIFAEQETPILVSIHNRKRLLPSYSIVAEVRGRQRDTSSILGDLKKILPAWLAVRLAKAPITRRTLSYFVHIPASRSIEKKNDHVFPYRGRFIIKDFELSTRFPFGFFRHRRRLAAKETELIVFPKISSVSVDGPIVPLDAGRMAVVKRGSGQDLLAMRGYQPNDDLRRIDWKATARSQTLMVREFASEDERRIDVFFDTRFTEKGDRVSTLRERIEAENSGKDPFRSERFESAVSNVAALVAHFCNEGSEVRLSTPGQPGDFGSGSRHLMDCLRRLAIIEPFSEKDAPDPFNEPLGSHSTKSPQIYTIIFSPDRAFVSTLPDADVFVY
ncbi:MAG TPA: DUF58 domain-containing protein [Pyrinomonadaceae bacterium]|nr:DUF58 domain-containing protein [Pyrinomonadaceae bacterium]